MIITRLALASVALLFYAAPHRPPALQAATSVDELIAAARGTSATMCILAAQGLGNGFGLQPPYPIVTASRTPIRTALREARTEAALPLLLRTLEDTDPCVREIGARLLGRQSGTAAAAGLEARLRSPDPSARAAAAYALGLTGSIGADALAEVLPDAAPAVRGNAVWALGRIGDSSIAGRVWRLVRDTEAPVRSAAVQTLAHLEASDSLPLIINALRTDPDAEVRRVAAWALAELDAAAGGDALTQALRHDDDEEVREMAAWALEDVGGAEVSAALTRALQEDDSEAVRATAVWALGSRGEEEALPLLVRSLDDSSEEIRSRAAWAIGSIEPEAAPAPLAAALRDPSAEVRHVAAWAIGQIADAAVLPALSAALEGERDDDVREAELRAMLRMGERDEAALARLLETGTPEIRSQAVAALAGRSLQPWPWPWPWPQPRPFP